MPRSILSRLMFASLLALTACHAPDYDPDAHDDEATLDSAARWQEVASDMWTEASARLKQNGYNETSIALEPPEKASPFSKAMDSFLFTEAVNHSVAVSPDSQFTFTYDTQVVRYNTGPNGIFSGIDYSELVLTLSVTDASTVRIRESKVFRIPDGEADLYQSADTKSDQELENRPLVSSNWYADTPHDVLPIVKHEDNQFSIMIDTRNGPVKNLNAAAQVAADHCGTLGQNQAKFIRQGYPTNDRTQIKVTYECL